MLIRKVRQYIEHQNLLQKGDKTSARQNLQKAIDMGDEAARMLMNTYLAQ